jgi:hypothetical protein
MRVLLLAVAAVVLGALGAAAALSISDSSLARSGSTTSTLPSVAPARTTEDVSGPCDEAEHADDARCAGTTTTTTAPRRDANRREDRARHRDRERHGRDDSGARGTVDNSGPGRSGGGGGSGDDNSGSGHGGGGNSGPGGGGHDGSGHGGGGRDHPEDD